MVRQPSHRDPEPSIDDVILTRRLFEEAQLLGIKARDDVIAGDSAFVSLLERGQIPHPPKLST